MSFWKNANWQHWALLGGAALTTLGTVTFAGDVKNPATWAGVVVQVVLAVMAVNKQPPSAQ